MSDNSPEQNSDDWISGEGGPLIVLQAGATSHWRGALDFENSKMNGGTLMTDYDIICEALDFVIRRYDRDMLVLGGDYVWTGRALPLPDESVAFVQSFCPAPELRDFVDWVIQGDPERSLPFRAEDRDLRLLVGADDGAGSVFGCVEVSIAPGDKRCDLYCTDEGWVFILTNP